MIRRFDRAAMGYENDARVQESVAGKLDDWMTALAIGGNVQRGLEIGCGSGLLTRRLLRRWPSAEWVITDIAPEMVRQCAGSCRHAQSPAIRFQVGDGEDANGLPGTFDLIVANLAVQWFEKPFDSVRNLAGKLNPGGWLVFSTLGSHSFETVRSRSGLPFYDYPSDVAWKASLAGCCGAVQVEEFRLIESAADLRAFLRELRQIGAATPPDHRPITRSELRHAIKRSAVPPSPLAIEYQILLVALQMA